ncbi:hypothetical protein V2J09_018578 [Rumex salicifolius]
MDAIMNKVGSYWVGQRANKELNSVGDDFNNLSSSIGDGTKWLVNKLKGKMQQPLPDLLKEYDLPIGIFPRDATHYEFDEKTGKLTVYVSQICEVGYKDSSVLKFANTVTGYLEKGKLADIEGMKTKLVIWVKVTCISTEKSKFYVTAGMKKSRSRDAYEVLRDGIEADKQTDYWYLEILRSVTLKKGLGGFIGRPADGCSRRVEQHPWSPAFGKPTVPIPPHYGLRHVPYRAALISIAPTHSLLQFP